jgi:hypothetical protein
VRRAAAHYAAERGQWDGAAAIVPQAGAPPHVVAISVWARGLGLARRRAAETRKELAQLLEIERKLHDGQRLLGTQTDILLRETMAWSAQAEHRHRRQTKDSGIK